MKGLEEGWKDIRRRKKGLEEGWKDFWMIGLQGQWMNLPEIKRDLFSKY